MLLAAAVPAFFIGIAFTCLLVCCFLRHRNGKRHSEPQSSVVNDEQSNYQGLDLTAMNSGDDNRQSLQVNSVTNEEIHAYENVDTYAGLNTEERSYEVVN